MFAIYLVSVMSCVETRWHIFPLLVAERDVTSKKKEGKRRRKGPLEDMVWLSLSVEKEGEVKKNVRRRPGTEFHVFGRRPKKWIVQSHTT